MTALELKNQIKNLSFGISSGYLPSVKAFEVFLTERNLAVSPESIKAFLSMTKLDGSPYSPSTISLRKVAIFQAIQSKAFDVRLKAEIREKAKDIKTPKADRKILSEKILTEKEIEKLIKGTNSLSDKGWSEKKKKSYSLIIKLLAISGLRISELCSITLSACETIKGFTYIQILGKGKKPRRIFIPKDFYQEIRDHFQSKNFLLVSSRGNQLRRIIVHRDLAYLSVRILGRHVNPHLFRHSFATREIKKRGSVKAVSLYLGHSKTAITEEMYNHEEIKPEELFT